MKATFYTRPVGHVPPRLVSRFQRRLTDEELLLAVRPVSRLVAQAESSDSGPINCTDG